MDVINIITRASALCAQVDGRTVSSQTLEAYKKQFRRMWERDDLDPLRPGVGLNTYYHRRAAVHFIGARSLDEAASECIAAIEARNANETVRTARKLHELVERLEPIFALDPPIPPGTLPWTLPPSRWHQSENAGRDRAELSKRHLLAVLPFDWDHLLWIAAPKEWLYRAPLAVLLTIPVRSEELMAGDRPTGFSPGVVLALDPSGLLALSFMPVKSHRGLFGTQRTTVTIDPCVADEPARYLALLCKGAGGRLVVSIDSKNGLRKAMSKLGAKVFPTIEDNITPNIARHQLIADMKTTFGAGEIVAAAAGHGTERTQSRYGYYQHGRKRRGYVSVVAARPPRTGFADRARRLKSAASNRSLLADDQ
ncbi:hypothetical protein [Nitrobacter sp. JJSN]|uniref:hypothetical protein n=1 Tax=Nitrobacter sp. JJSN TaxID=3453033 RepID=UPI003F75D066